MEQGLIAQYKSPPRCLWISRDIPFPLDAGDRMYSANLALALCDSGMSVRFTGFADHFLDRIPGEFTKVEWVAVGGKKRGRLSSAFRSLPLQAATHDTHAYGALLRKHLADPWDVIVLDSYGSGWALGPIASIRRKGVWSKEPLLVYVSHNYESALWKSLASQAEGSVFRRMLLGWNAIKVRKLERSLVASVDLVSANTPEDGLCFDRDGKNGGVVILSPGYSGRSAPPRIITAKVPRRALIVGSFRWVTKQENLRTFLRVADAIFLAQGIELDVVGDIPAQVRDELRASTSATHFHGFVDDLSPFMGRARLALVPEMIGGGFKHKFLDYCFARVPIVSIRDAAQCLPEQVRMNVISAENLTDLTERVVENIDNLQRLNELQEAAYSAAARLFDWKDRGLAMRAALDAIRRVNVIADS
jgi:polysaccharide biosynthesis protein PslH